jgi:hypothetical protein
MADYLFVIPPNFELAKLHGNALKIRYYEEEIDTNQSI